MQRVTVEVGAKGETVPTTTEQDEARIRLSAIFIRTLVVTAIQFQRQPATRAIAQQRLVDILQIRNKKWYEHTRARVATCTHMSVDQWKYMYVQCTMTIHTYWVIDITKFPTQ